MTADTPAAASSSWTTRARSLCRPAMPTRSLTAFGGSLVTTSASGSARAAGPYTLEEQASERVLGARLLAATLERPPAR